MFLDVVGRRAIPANAAQLWAERHSFTQAFWGFFGGVNVPLPDAIYLIFNIIGGIGIIGALAFIANKLVRGDVRRVSAWLPHAVTLLWIAITFISYLRWTAETWASQGRLIFVALSPILVWMALGWLWWLPLKLRPVLLGVIVAGFFAVAVITPFAVIAPAYAMPEAAEADVEQAVFRAADAGEVVLLAAYDLPENVQPGDYAQFAIDWQLKQPFTRNWSLFAHLVTPDGVIIAQRDVYPGGGALATSDLPVGYAWRNPVAIPVPNTAYAPTTLSVEIGWYDLATGERLTLPDGAETYTVGTVELQPRTSDLGVPNPISINFDNQIELVGYELSSLAPVAGETVELTLYWRALQPIAQDYIVFAHIIDPRTTMIFAGSDAMPANWTAPTSTWQVGTIITDTHPLAVSPDTPPGIYEVEVGLYLNPGDGTFPRLRVVTPDGGMADDFAYLTRVRVLPRVQ